MSCSTKRCPAELCGRAVRMVAEVRHEHSSEWAAVESVAGKLGGGTPQTLLNWVRRGQIDTGKRVRVSSDAAEELRRLRAENRELKRANEIVKSASTFFAAELDRQRK